MDCNSGFFTNKMWGFGQGGGDSEVRKGKGWHYWHFVISIMMLRVHIISICYKYLSLV